MRYCMMIQLIIAFSPLFVGVYASCIKLVDYRYFYNDIAVGGILGFATAFISYFIHYKEFYCKNIEYFWVQYTSLDVIRYNDIDSLYNI